jgi:predicted RNA binding protein YcfA (HicA-like mRNA interferase family)
MTKLPRVTGKNWLARYARLVFEVIKGGHYFLRHPDGRCTVVPVHRGETVGPGLMSKILRDCEMTRDELLKFLHE